ncbi:MAG: hypothetical protein JGK17_16685 [Microcoleus sp. PH2017_10_PVI_O_A]|uniref:hypothetical protein n=1 Tax=unclassified Microcoleus TaxID=2642155 RepID=UPI001DABC0A5|nr:MULTISPECIES: hypothetical protein [unclassified Microcoleus]MCC3407197.1 hypothetical protein [Microcoleus sp. PH2017_10_PVI_O_A]MCC3461205.1 hypothetical protein [Microcoleus sp. PH2017_11_PCY_U_A]MCC3479728.1 hypothetical protein [Microcoleus sp. PH2017_12_PCY_D_A]MCC3529700.1 hypothetical protein [Microcoleus sp. PH2017_21_RUC_O_A]MCC3541891.1 hypothetical protein [Microcoleus sp. PH2017_22_RUC_O_B]
MPIEPQSIPTVRSAFDTISDQLPSQKPIAPCVRTEVRIMLRTEVRTTNHSPQQSIHR